MAKNNDWQTCSVIVRKIRQNLQDVLKSVHGYSSKNRLHFLDVVVSCRFLSSAVLEFPYSYPSVDEFLPPADIGLAFMDR